MFIMAADLSANRIRYLLSYAVNYVTHFCNINVLRFLNVVFMSYLGKQLYDLLGRTCKIIGPSNGDAQLLQSRQAYLAHTALNICLFPPLMFFSGLYYTDLAAVVFVLFAIHAFFVQNESQPWFLALVEIGLGLWALLLRQTNVFWVGLFPIGIAVLRLSLDKQKTSKQTKGRPTIEGKLSLDWLTDCLRVVDYLSAVADVIMTVFRNIPAVVVNTWQYVTVISLFGLFVFWNGGVVLGDKANHVATIHLAQMLYIWPYIFFFSFPIILHQTLLSNSPSPVSKLWAMLSRLWVLLSFTVLALLVVHFNTIVHPFTLADNRHYVFYVFRLLRRHPAIKYLAAPVYVSCGWLVLGALFPDSSNPSTEIQRKSRILFSLVWILTSAACLVTAPLVEPRYLIIPWIIWRLAAAPWTEPARLRSSTPKKRSQGGWLTWLQTPRAALWIETIWLLSVNAVTMYVFLFWGFEWKQEKGAVQRFMW
jgi:alpha-1,2-glucosyltransferase